MDFNGFLEKLQTKSSTVAINISTKSTMEIMEIDKNGTINSYAEVPIQYNNFSKELENVYEFQSSLKQAFSDLKLSTSSKVYVSIPTYVLENENLPDLDDDEAIKTILLSSIEKNYIFKKYDPAISYFKYPQDNKNGLSVCCTALRLDEYTKIKNVFEELGLKVLAIDSSYSALINGVIATNKVNPDLINRKGKWNIINITSNSYVIYSMEGKLLTSMYEEPLAVKSFTEEEIYQVIVNSLDLVLNNYPAEQIVVVSQADNVSAEYLASVVNVSCPITHIEDNKYRKPLVETSLNITQSLKTKISLEAVGISTWATNFNGFKFNFLDAPIETDNVVESITLNINGQDIELTPGKLQKWAILIGLIVVILGTVAYFFCLIQYNGTNAKKITIVENSNRIKNELKIQPQATGINESEFLQKNYSLNVNYRKSYSSISKEIPDMLWIEEFQLLDTSKMYLKGRSYRMDDVLNYYDSLSKLGKFENLKISSLKISNTEISDLLLEENSTMQEETTYEFAFGEPVYTKPNNTTEANQKTDANGVTLPPPAAPPAPTKSRR